MYHFYIILCTRQKKIRCRMKENNNNNNSNFKLIDRLMTIIMEFINITDYQQ